MIATREHVRSFQEFALERLSAGGRPVSMDELFEQWRLEHPSDDELSADVLAIEASLRDMRAGETGRDLQEVVADIRERRRSAGGR
jgi:hypothetical protein